MTITKKIIGFLLVVAFSCSVTLTGCVYPMRTLRDADVSVKETQDRIERTMVKSTLPSPAAVTYPGYYVNPVPINLKQPPAWLNRKITLQAQNVPLSFLVSRILRDTNITVNYQPDVNQNQIVSMNYSGSIKGALNQLAANTNYSYSTTNGELVWDAFVTKTFNIAFMPGTSSYQVGQSQGLGAGEAASVANVTSNTGTNNIVTQRGDLGEQQYSNLKGNLSVWDDLRQTLLQLKSPEGKIYVSESTTLVTVYDHPANVRAIQEYIEQLNRDLSREVAIQVEVLEIELNKDFNWGIDWNLLFSIEGTRLGLRSQLGTAANIAGAITQGAAAGNALSVFQIGSVGGSNVLINALSRQGKLRVVTQPRVVTMNNQMAEIKITRDVGYLQSVSNTTVGNSGLVNNNSTQTLTPGVVTDGFSLYLLPKIQGKKIYLQISSNLSVLTALDYVSNNGTTNQPTNINSNNGSMINIDNTTNNGTPFQAIQVPTLANKSFNQRTIVSNGNTLVITGFQQLRDATDRDQLAGIKPLGGTGAARSNVQTIVLITPTILPKN